MILFAPSSAVALVADGDVANVVDVNGNDDEETRGKEMDETLSSGSCGSGIGVSDECIPTGFNGKRRVPLFGLGVRFSESQSML